MVINPSSIQSKAADLQNNSASAKTEARCKVEKNLVVARDISHVALSSSLNSVGSLKDFSQAEESTRIARNDISTRFDHSVLAHGNFDPKTILSLLE